MKLSTLVFHWAVPIIFPKRHRLGAYLCDPDGLGVYRTEGTKNRDKYKYRAFQNTFVGVIPYLLISKGRHL